jgi:hypothetical protein
VSNNPNIRLRNQRVPGWYWSQNELIDEVARQIGVYGIAVYNVLARLSRHDEVSGVSAASIAATLGCSRAQVFRALAALETAGALMRRSVSGAESSYILVDLKSKNLPPVSVSDGYAADNPSQSATGGVSDRARTRLNQRHANKEAKLQDCKTDLSPNPLTDDLNSTGAAMVYCHAFSVSGGKNGGNYDAIRDAIEVEGKHSTDKPQEIADRMILARQQFNTIPKAEAEFDGNTVYFVTSGMWKQPGTWRKDGAVPTATSPRVDPKAERKRQQDLEDRLKREGIARRAATAAKKQAIGVRA